jgi:hypothetical protein
METSAIPPFLQSLTDAPLHFRPRSQRRCARVDLGGSALNLRYPGIVERPGESLVALGQKSLDQLKTLVLG